MEPSAESHSGSSSYHHLTANQERELGLRIKEIETELRSSLQTVPESIDVLREPVAEERTRGGAVERLEAALSAAEAARDSSPGGLASRARVLWQESQRLRWRLAMSAADLVRHEARRFARDKVDREDLEAEGRMGLFHAAQRFEPERGYRFSSYARWWVRASMHRAVRDQLRTVRLSGLAQEQLQALARAREQLGENSTLLQVAAHAEVSEKRARWLLSHHEVVSLDAQIPGTQTPRTRHDTVEDEHLQPADEALRLAESRAMVRSLVELLPGQRERHVIIRRFGLDDDTPRTRAEIGAELGISRERVRTLERRALRWLRRYVGQQPLPPGIVMALEIHAHRAPTWSGRAEAAIAK